MSHISPIAQRLRITFGKAGTLKYTSNLDVAKIWERTLRRADLPILYSKGFNTRPRIQLAMPLPLGITSDCEILDVALRETICFNEAALRRRLLRVAPAGLTIAAIEDVDLRESALHGRIISAEYRIRFYDEVSSDMMRRRISELLAQESIIVERVRRRKRSVMDIRPLIIELTVDDQGDLLAHLSVGDRGNLRPDHLLEQLGLHDRHYSAHRRKLHVLPD